MRSRRRCAIAAAGLLLLASSLYTLESSVELRALGPFTAAARLRPRGRLGEYTGAGVAERLAAALDGSFGRFPAHNRTGADDRGAADDSVPFRMCDRRTPFRHAVDPASGLPRVDFWHAWPRGDRILLLRNDGKFGHLGDQVTSLLRAFDYAADHGLDLGILFHSWAMDALQTMFYETADFDELVPELRRDLGLLVVREQSQLAAYAGVVHKNAEQLRHYRPTAAAADRANGWQQGAAGHAAFLRRLFVRYNRGYGYVHNGLRARDVCGTLDMFFHERASDARYTVIHSRYLDGNATGILEQMAKTVGLTVKGGALFMGPDYIKAILEPLGMLDFPVVLLTDGQLRSVARGLLNDPVLGPNMMVLSDKAALDGGDVALAVLSDVFVGNPASATAGLVARARGALGYPPEVTQLFRQRRSGKWSNVCDEGCVFNPWIMDQWT